MQSDNKAKRAQELGISRSSLYYIPKQPAKDWQLKCEIEKVLRMHPGYGHKRLAIELGVNKKRVLRVMKIFGLEPYRRRGKKWKKPPKEAENLVKNMLMETVPEKPNHIWATDFTHIDWKDTRLYFCTMMDLFTRRIVGYSVLTNHTVQLVINAFFMGINKYPPPEILHSDRGSEYTSKDMLTLCRILGTTQSMSRAGCPWENGYQESFYSHFKVDLGDPQRFNELGELIYEIYHLVHVYNTSRIHSALKMPPQTFALQHSFTEIAS